MAREGLLLHAGDDPIHTSEPDAPKKRGFGDFWYYHKWHVLIVLLAAVFAAFLLRDLFFTPRPDYQVGFVSEKPLSEPNARKLEQELARYGTDLNGDGRVMVQLNRYVFPSNRTSLTQADAADWVRFQGDATNGTCVIYFTDEASFLSLQKELKMFGSRDGSAPAAGQENSAGIRIPLTSCAAFSNLLALNRLEQKTSQDADHLENIGISVRVKDGVPANYDAACRKMYGKLLSAHAAG